MDVILDAWGRHKVKWKSQITNGEYTTDLWKINPSSLKGGCNNPPTVFALVLKITQPRGKIAPGTFKFILELSLHFSEKFRAYPYTGGRVSFQRWEVRGGWCDPVIFELDYFENIWSDMHSQVCLQVRMAIENRMFLRFFT